MLIESVAAAGLILKSLNETIQAVNEGKANIQTAMSMRSDFGQGLNEFQASRQNSMFKPLSNSDVLKIQMIRRSQERYEKDLREMLLFLDSKLLEDYDKAIADNKRQHQQHLNYLAKKRKARQQLMAQISVGMITLIIGSLLIWAGLAVMFQVYS